jgi:hypothetical protein
MNASGLVASLMLLAAPASTAHSSTCDEGPPRFKYIIADKALLRGGQPIREEDVDQAALLRLTILLDRDAYSEANLKTLLCLLSRRFPRPELVVIFVYTNVKQLPTPEQAEEGGLTGMPEDPNIRRYHRAYMERSRDSELIRYQDKPGGRMKTVYLKGGPPKEGQKE